MLSGFRVRARVVRLGCISIGVVARIAVTRFGNTGFFSTEFGKLSSRLLNMLFGLVHVSLWSGLVGVLIGVNQWCSSS